MRAAVTSFVGGNRVGFALAFSVDMVGIHAFADQVVLDSVGAALRELHVVGFGADGIGVAGGNQRFQVNGVGLFGNLIKDVATFGLDGRFVEVEERVGVQDNLGGRRRFDGSFGNWYAIARSEEHTSELQSLMRISYAVFGLKKKKKNKKT